MVIKTALITGASSGIGSAIARVLAQQNIHVVLVARRLQRLNSLAQEIKQAGGSAAIIQADLTQEVERINVYEQVLADSGNLDILINNAGLGWYGYYADMPWDIALEVLQVNITAVAHLTNLFLPEMRARNSGHIINIGSIAGSFPNQGVALYSASKSFLDSFTNVLHRELTGTHVECSVARVGPVATEFYDQAAHRPAGLPIPAERFAITAEEVAHRIWGLIERPRKVIYIPRALVVVPWVELLFGWLVDRLGPLLLKRASADL